MSKLIELAYSYGDVYEDENDKPCGVYLSNAMIEAYSRTLVSPYVEALEGLAAKDFGAQGWDEICEHFALKARQALALTPENVRLVELGQVKFRERVREPKVNWKHNTPIENGTKLYALKNGE